MWFVLCILDRAIFTAVSSAIKVLDIFGKLEENVSFELRKTAAAETFRTICEDFLVVWIVVFEFIIKGLIHFWGGICFDIGS